MTIPGWADRYVGIRYVDKGRTAAGLDCWGLVLAVYRDQYGRTLPDHADHYRDGEDWPAIARTVAAERAAGWLRTEQPREGDVVVLNIAKRPWHCGVMLGSLAFLHAAPGDSVVWDRLDHGRWAKRIEGIYRHG